MHDASTTKAFWSTLAGGPATANRDTVETKLAEVVALARAAWPEVEIAPPAFARYLADRAKTDDPLAYLDMVHAADLYLACGCVHRDPRAQTAFDRVYRPDVVRFLSRRGEDQAEVVQELWVKQLMANDDRPPRLSEYRGLGPLAAWIRVAATRLAIDADRRKKRSPTPSPGPLPDLPAEGLDPELQALRARYLADFNAAFEAAFRLLSARERNALRLYHEEGLGIDDIGSLYRVHRATAARWVAGGRKNLLEATKRLLVETLSLSVSDVDSLIRMMKSQLGWSIRACVARAPRDEGEPSPARV